MERIKFIDLFCGIGGFRIAMDEASFENDLIPECVFSSDIDHFCQDSYEANFGERPAGDITKINESGDFLWQKLLGGTNSDFAFCVKKTTDNGYIIAGDTGSTNGDVLQNFGFSDFWLIKLSPEQLSNSIFQQENLFIYPNPTTNLINLKFPHGIAIDKIIITELTGKIILTLTENTTQINTENLSNGVYFVQAFSEEKKYQSKFIKQ